MVSQALGLALAVEKEGRGRLAGGGAVAGAHSFLNMVGMG